MDDHKDVDTSDQILVSVQVHMILQQFYKLHACNNIYYFSNLPTDQQLYEISQG